MARKKPELNLTPELPQVVSRDFNLFYKPEAEPQTAGMKEFTASLNNFVNGAGSSMAIASTVKEKKVNSAEALKDYNENKLKFKEAVKSGAVDKTANPFYLEKYRELSLNEYASEFNSFLIKQYGDKDVKTDITEGSFDNFYQDSLKQFVRDKNLGTFNALDLEKGFFQETSNYRASLEAQHQQTQLELFKKKFNEKVTNRVVGIVLKHKDKKLDPTVDGENTNVFELIANDINKEIKELIDVTGDGRDVIDIAFNGLAGYVGVTDDVDFAKKLINKIPELLIGGTDSVAKIGRIKTKQKELYSTLLEKQQENIDKENKFFTTQQVSERLTTYNFLEKNKDNPDFNLVEWKSNPNRTSQEKLAYTQFKQDDAFKSTTVNDGEVILEIEQLLIERKFLEAHDLVSKAYRNEDITLETKKNYHQIRIANVRDFKEHPLFTAVKPVADTLKSLEKVLASGKAGGDVLQASFNLNYIQGRLFEWIKANENKEIYQGNSHLLQRDFEKEYLQSLKDLKEYASGNTLFGKGGVGLEGKGTVYENIDKRIKQGVSSEEEKKSKKKKDKRTPQDTANMIIDLKAISSADFRSKYGITKEQFKKEISK